MGESLVETLKVENKMDESIPNSPCFQQSVSFGRFERDSLCWERWSTFPTNKYLEEVEKCSTPGSVAKKKAYFEAHYKKIAARRAELILDQEREREAEMAKFDESFPMSSVCKTNEEVLDNEKVDTENAFSDSNQLEIEVSSWDGEASNEHVHIESSSSDQLNQENEVDSFDRDVGVEHVHVKSGSVDDVKPENGAWDLPGEMSGHDVTGIAIDDDELSNVVSEKSEDVDELKDDDKTIDEQKDEDKTIHEANEVMEIEVTKDIHELIDGGDVIPEKVKSEMTEHSDEPNDGPDTIKVNDKRPQEEIFNTDFCPTSKISELGNFKKPSLVTEDVLSIPESKAEDLPQEKVKRTIIEEKSGNLMKLPNSKKMQKETLVKKTNRTTNTQKLPASPVPKRTTAPMPKSPMLATPKKSKPELTKVAKSASRILDKKESGFTPLTIKKTIGSQSKRVLPTSLHMSLSLGPTNPDQASLTMRKSLIMESMGDKDIVKRAFKAFQKSPQVSSASLVKSPATNESASRKAEKKSSLAHTLPKKNEGSGRATKTASGRTDQQGTRKTLLSSSVNKNGGADQRNLKSVAASFSPRVQLPGNNLKEDSKKVGLKPRSNILAATNLQSKVKVEKAALVKNPSQIISSKPKLLSSIKQRQGGTLQKEEGKAQTTSG